MSDLDCMADRIAAAVAELAQCLIATNRMMACAESCTGGMVAAACTALAGSSAWFERGMVTYSNQAKQQMLGVPAELIATHGAVSEPVARAMAEGALRHSQAQLSLAITGIAGPSGGSEEKPVGTVWFAWAASPSQTQNPAEQSITVVTRSRIFPGHRQAVREAACLYALGGLLDLARKGSLF
ncbi:CinA family protein [Allofranklinella schreckenbergeri]|nr:CinA family protein [Allofranklinella schreckenbergeri]